MSDFDFDPGDTPTIGSHAKKEQEQKYGLNFNLYRLKANFKSTRLNKVLNFPLFLNPILFIKVISIYYLEKPQVVHTHDLPMAPFGMLLKYLFRVKFILDLHENYPDALIYFNKKGAINYLIKNPKFAKILEKMTLKYSDKIIFISCRYYGLYSHGRTLRHHDDRFR